MLEIDLNLQLADLLKQHGVGVDITNGFIHTNMPGNVKFRVRTVYEEINKSISSRLDVMAVTDKGEEMYESFGDYGVTIEEAVNNNFQNFCAGSLHPLLAALGCSDEQTHNQITIEEWDINGKVWNAYIGNLVYKNSEQIQVTVAPPPEFFNLFEQGIKAQQLTNRLHWFRGYYSQINDEITNREFLMDNELVEDANTIFQNLPVLPGIKFYSCRNFIILKDKASGL